MDNYLIRNAKIVNNGLITHGFVLVRGGIIRAVGAGEPGAEQELAENIDAGGSYLLPGAVSYTHLTLPTILLV